MDVYTCMLICLQYNGHNGISLENNTIYIYIYIIILIFRVFKICHTYIDDNYIHI
jgi:hypothetical protein